jgi:hypothetical protein
MPRALDEGNLESLGTIAPSKKDAQVVTQTDPTTSASALNARAIECKLMEAADLIAGTCQQPADPRAWDTLLIYCPPEAIERRLAAIERREQLTAQEEQAELEREFAKKPTYKGPL